MNAVGNEASSANADEQPPKKIAFKKESVIIKPLSRETERKGFCCGRPLIDNFFQSSAWDQHRKNQVRVHVATAELEAGGRCVLGFYSLAVQVISVSRFKNAFFSRVAKLFDRHKMVPVVYIAMLGVSNEYQQCGVGSMMLSDALFNAYEASKNIGIHGVALDAATDLLVKFYEKSGFHLIAGEGENRTMFVTCREIQDAFQKAK